MSPVLFSFEDFINWMKAEDNLDKNYKSPPEDKYLFEKPAGYPCIVSHYHYDDVRSLEEIYTVLLDDFLKNEDCRHIAKVRIG